MNFQQCERQSPIHVGFVANLEYFELKHLSDDSLGQKSATNRFAKQS